MKLRKIQYNSPVVLTFALLSLLALILGRLTGDLTTVKLFSVYRSSLRDLLTYPRFFCHVLGHSGYEHFMGNMLYILILGPSLEEKYGGRALLAAMALTAFTSGLAHFIFFPNVMLLGASGIVFMMIVMSSFAGMRDGCIPLTLILVLVLYVGGEIVAGISRQDNVSQITHIIGGACGAVSGFVLAKKR